MERIHFSPNKKLHSTLKQSKSLNRPICAFANFNAISWFTSWFITIDKQIFRNAVNVLYKEWRRPNGTNNGHKSEDIQSREICGDQARCSCISMSRGKRPRLYAKRPRVTLEAIRLFNVTLLHHATNNRLAYKPRRDFADNKF